MSAKSDPFLHLPELRDQIIDPRRSEVRELVSGNFQLKMRPFTSTATIWRNDAQIESLRHEFLNNRGVRDIWVFAYGSLMWDPAFYFAEVRRGRVLKYSRQFCLLDTLGGRGTSDTPGLMAALAPSEDLCEGLLFRIASECIDKETRILWRREMFAPAYQPIFESVITEFGTIEALIFVADTKAAMIRSNLTRSEKIQYIVTGKGLLGTSLEYLRNLESRCAALGISDREIMELCRAIDMLSTE